MKISLKGLFLGLISFLVIYPTFSNELELLTNNFLQKHVESGVVDYQAIADNDVELLQLMQLYGLQSLDNYSQTEVKAFYINAYNIAVIFHVVDNYPIVSPQEVAGFFDSKKVVIAGENLTLNQIEKQKLDPKVDPRLHFVLVCAAKSCPVIEPFSYTGNNLDIQLDQQTKKALNDPTFIRLDKDNERIELSKIFSWYKSDFKEKASDIISYINKYRDESISASYQLTFYEYDWTLNAKKILAEGSQSANLENKSNLQLFTPSALFNWGQYEVNMFNSAYIQSSSRNSEGEEEGFPGGESQSFVNVLLQFTTGITKSSRFNVGIDVNLTTARYGQGESLNNFFSEETTTFRKTVISSIGPRVKFVPFNSIPRLSLQSTFLFPITDTSLEVPRFIAHNRYTWFTQIFFDQNIGESFQLFLEADVLHRIKKEAHRSNFTRTPLSAFLSYFPSPKLTVYVFSQYSPRFENVYDATGTTAEFGLSQWFTQVGLGSKYQITSKLGMEISYSDFIDSRSDGAGYTVNFGLRYIYR